jgi:two-component system sensor histidine kinase LytS
VYGFNTQIVLNLVNSLAVMFVLTFVLLLSRPFRLTLYASPRKLTHQILLAVVFGGFGILGTYYGLPVDGAISNTRAVPVVAAGLLGGPFVGIGAGIVAGAHRYLMDIGGFTAVACGISTVVEGMVGAVAYALFLRSRQRWAVGFGATVVAELLQMSIILAIARPYSAALTLVQKIVGPMTLINALGVALFLLLHESFLRSYETEGALQSELALKIADKTLPIFRQGYSYETARRVCEIIYAEAHVDAVALTSHDEIMAHVGAAADHHSPGLPAQTELTRAAIRGGTTQEAHTALEIGCLHKECPLQSVIVVPLVIEKRVIGALKLYRTRPNEITSLERQLALGLARLFSTQLEIAERQMNEILLSKAELRALQAQINPHFIFNALNTIVSFCRTDSETARNLLVRLGDFLRRGFADPRDFIPLRQELGHVEAYLEIERARFGDRLRVEYDVEVEDIMVPPLILQPLVENAVRHGIMPTTAGGTLHIRTTLVDNECLITVKDTGVGFDPLTGLSGNGIGLKNVDKRLRNIYGDAFGVNIYSQLGEGTVCTVRVPMGEGENVHYVHHSG